MQILGFFTVLPPPPWWPTPRPPTVCVQEFLKYLFNKIWESTGLSNRYKVPRASRVAKLYLHPHTVHVQNFHVGQFCGQRLDFEIRTCTVLNESLHSSGLRPPVASTFKSRLARNAFYITRNLVINWPMIIWHSPHRPHYQIINIDLLFGGQRLDFE